MSEEDKGGGDSLEALQTKVGELEGLLEKAKGSADEVTRLKGELEKADGILMSDDFIAFKNAQRRGEDPGDKGKGSEEVDFSSMSGKELADWVKSQQSEAVAAATKGFDDKFSTLSNQIGAALAGIDLEMNKLRDKSFAESYKDKTYRERFYNVAKENPSWDALKVKNYLNNEIENERRTVEEEKKRTEEAELDALGEKGGPAQTNFSEKSMTAEKAAEAAYRKSFGTDRSEG